MPRALRKRRAAAAVVRFIADDKTRERLLELVEHHELTMSALLRKLIADAHKAIAP